MKHVIEAGYPSTFRQKETRELDNHLTHHHSVVLIGMKRVGISNFLRFFLSHKETQFFVLVDLNDLIERNLSAFWTLLLTRLVDNVQRSSLPETEKIRCRRLFVQSIQLKDHFFTLDSARKVLEILVSTGITPTIFLLRFDRLSEVATPEFFSNLIGLRDAIKGRMSYVFTSYRPIIQLGPVIIKDMYLPPATPDDMKIILETLTVQYHASFDEKTQDNLIALSGGYVQYLQLAIIRLREEKNIPGSRQELFSLLAADEQIIFQSEELYESLTKKEKELLLSGRNWDVSDANYLRSTGMVKNGTVFSPIFTDYLRRQSNKSNGQSEFTKKEHLLFTFLEAHIGQLCEREAIIEGVWPENIDLGVSDWAIDRLVARLRAKLKAQGSPYSVVTVVTRGYKLVKGS